MSYECHNHRSKVKIYTIFSGQLNFFAYNRYSVVKANPGVATIQATLETSEHSFF